MKIKKKHMPPDDGTPFILWVSDGERYNPYIAKYTGLTHGENVICYSDGAYGVRILEENEYKKCKWERLKEPKLK